jgi:hypothetical protein
MDTVTALSAAAAGAGMLAGAVVLLLRLRAHTALPRLGVDAALARGGAGAAVVLGRAELDGGEPLRSPVSDRPCVWWELEAAVLPGRGSAALLTRRTTASSAVFLLAGATGRVRVHPAGLRRHRRLRGARVGEVPADTPSPHLRPHVTGRIAARFPWLAPGPGAVAARYTEWLVEEGREVAVTGHLFGDGGGAVVAHGAGARRGVFAVAPAEAVAARTRLLGAVAAALGAGGALCTAAALLAAGLPG